MARKDIVVGLDIGRYAVKAVWATRRGADFAVTRAEVLRLPLDGSGGPAVITPWLQKLDLTRHPCVLSISGNQLLFQPFTLPPGDPRGMDQAAAMEVLRFNELASESMLCGYAPIAIKEGDRRLLLAMARQSIVDEVLEMAREMRLNVVDLVPSPVALVNSQTGSQAPSEATVYLDIGHAATSVAVASPAGLLFARAFGGGGQLFTDAIARARGLTTSQAENLKTTQVTFTDATGAPVADLLQPASLWLNELQSCLSLYNLLYPEPACRLARLVVCGGAAQLRGFPAWIGARINLPLAAACKIAGLPQDAPPEGFAVAAGLASGALGIASTTISLLPAMLKDELMFRRQKPIWIAAVVTAALILAVSLFGGSRDIRHKSALLREQRESLARRQQLVAQIEGIQARNEEIRRMVTPLAEMLRGAPVMRDLLTLVSKVKAPSDSITMVSDAETYFEGRSMPGAARATRRRRGEDPSPDAVVEIPRLNRVVIEGYTRRSSLATVRDLISRIRESKSVESADLLNDDQLVPPPEGEAAARRGLRFVIDVKLRSP